MHEARMGSGCRVQILKGDLVTQDVSAIVNAANQRMLGGGGVDGAIHRAAGPALLEACRGVEEVSPGVRCPTGEARITPGFDLPARYVIHTVGPVYAEHPDPSGALRAAHLAVFAIAREQGLRSVAFPAISCGVFGFPPRQAATISLEVCRESAEDFEEIRFVLFHEELCRIWTKAVSESANPR